MKNYIVKQQVEPGHVRLVECDTYGIVTVHRTKAGARAVVDRHGKNNGYFVERGSIRRDKTHVDIVD